jgi:hypothetical protein
MTKFLRGALIFAGFLTIAFPAIQGEAQTITVTLLGTGTPAPRIQRFGPSLLVEEKSRFKFSGQRAQKK